MSSKANRSTHSRKERKLQALFAGYREAPTEKLALRITRILEKCGRYGEAFKWAKHARARYPSSKRAARCYRRLKRTKTRISLRRAGARARAQPTADNLARLCELLRISGKWRKAHRVGRSADRKFPDNWQVQLALGRLYFERFSRTLDEDDGWSAVDFLDNSRCLNPANFSTLILLAVSLVRLQSYENAAIVIDEALQIDPSNERALNIRAHIGKALAPHVRRPPARPSGVGRSVPTESSSRILKRVLAIPGAVGAFHFGEDGRVADSVVRESDAFDFAVPVEVFEAMANACRLDTHRIGLGEFRSCSLSGDGWSMDYHASDSGPVLAFFQGVFTGEHVEGEMSKLLGDVADPVSNSAEKVGDAAR